MERRGHAQPLGLPQRAGDQLDLRRAARLDVLEHGSECALPRLVASTFISQGLVQLDPRRGATALPSSMSAWTRWPRSDVRSSAAKCGSCGSPVSAATAFTVALKISFDHCAGLRSGNARAFRPER